LRYYQIIYTSKLSNATKINLHYAFVIFRYISLKSLVIALAKPAFFASSIKKWLWYNCRFIFPYY